MSCARVNAVHSEPTIGTQSRYEIVTGDGFGTYQKYQVQSDNFVPSRNGINPIVSKVGMGIHSDVL